MRITSNTKLLLLRYLFWTLAGAVMVLIFLSSAQTAPESSDTSASFTETVLKLVFPKFSELSADEQSAIVSGLQFVVRKGAHFSVYLLLAALCFFAMNTYQIKFKSKLLTAGAVSCLYAVTDEVHQLFVEGRAGRVSDVLIDSAGAVCGIALAVLLLKLFRALKNKRRASYEKKTGCI